ncbi:hypothetical protein H0H93_002621 [Arthromyces matolae]|nr:hypothetical protein H0H93_002621 [Arthromyces matolae]
MLKIRKNALIISDRRKPSKHELELPLYVKRFRTLNSQDEYQSAYAALLEKTTELSHATAEIGKAKLTADAAYELAARTRGREEMGKLRELELEQKVKAAEEAAKMSDLVVNEYADLVRSLKAGDSHEKLVDGLSEGKGDLKAQGLITFTKSKSVTQKNHVKQCRIELAQAQFELQQLKTDNNAAAKMQLIQIAHRKFSQKSTDTLSTALTALKTRHEATTTTLSSQLYSLRFQIHASEPQTEVLCRALDELGGQLAKEAFGHRRDVATDLRLACQEGYEDVARKMVDAARAVLEGTLGGYEGSMGRVVAAEAAVRELTVELEEEMRRRLELERILAVENASASVPDNAAKFDNRRSYEKPVDATGAPIPNPDNISVAPSTVTAGLPESVPSIIVDTVETHPHS